MMSFRLLVMLFSSLFFISAIHGMSNTPASTISTKVASTDRNQVIITKLRTRCHEDACYADVETYFNAQKTRYSSLLHFLVNHKHASDVLASILKKINFHDKFTPKDIFMLAADAIDCGNVKAIEVFLNHDINIFEPVIVESHRYKTNILLYVLTMEVTEDIKEICKLIINHQKGYWLINAFGIRPFIGSWEKITPLQLLTGQLLHGPPSEKNDVRDIIDMLLQRGANPYLGHTKSAMDLALAAHEITLAHIMRMQFKKNCIEHLAAMLSTKAKKLDETNPVGPFLPEIAQILAGMVFSHL